MRTPNTRSRVFGVDRVLDGLSRVVIPKDMMRELRWSAGDTIRVRIVEDGVLLTLPATTCHFCYKEIVEEHPLEIDGRGICRPCAKAVAEGLLVTHGR